jgi:ribose transport system permease protein
MMNEKKNKLVYYAQDFGALIALVLLVIGISFVSPQFRTVDNFLSLLRQSSINGFIAFGMTFVILTDAIDLSVGSVLALSTVLCAGMITAGVPVGIAMLLALAIGALLGLVSGLLVTKGRLQPFIATLITMTVYRGLTMIYTNGKPISNLGNSYVLKLVGK